MYEAIVSIFVSINFIIAIILWFIVIGSALWDWIDDKDFNSVLPKIGEKIGIDLSWVDDPFLDIVVSGITGLALILSALLWPVPLVIAVVVVAKILRRKYKKEKENDSSTTD